MNSTKAVDDICVRAVKRHTKKDVVETRVQQIKSIFQRILMVKLEIYWKGCGTLRKKELVLSY